MAEIIKILIVEDQVILRESMENFLNSQKDMRVAGVTGSAGKAPELCKELLPDLVLMDVLTEDECSGFAATVQIRQELPDIKIVMITALPEITFIAAAKKAGAHSFVYKNMDSEYLLFAIRSTMKGQGVYPGPPANRPFKVTFTDTEIAVIRLICQGKTHTEITGILAMSDSSIRRIITDILNKTGFDSIMKFAVYAVANGFIVPNI
ncbi:MAG: response regulator transcription factor [Treponema sp.]|jgi:DNA-binding NarL/FixJ family response regulator|nr:response regulator transcription factor [Treponema sp.]